MQTLNQATAAKVIKNSKIVPGAVVMLPAGTRYRTVGHTFEPLGYTVTRIAIGREKYDIMG